MTRPKPDAPQKEWKRYAHWLERDRADWRREVRYWKSLTHVRYGGESYR